MSPAAWLRRINSFRSRLGLGPLTEVPRVTTTDQPYTFRPDNDLEDPDADEDNRAWFEGTLLCSPEATVVELRRNIKAITAVIG